MTQKTASIQFHFLAPCYLPDRRALRAFIASVFKKEKRSLKQLKIIFCGDEYLLELNRQFLNHDFYTDILSFPLSVPGQPLEAEIYISVDRVRENAGNMAVSLKNELHRVIFHGILHFCGYEDKTRAQIISIRLREDKLLRSYFRSNA